MTTTTTNSFGLLNTPLPGTLDAIPAPAAQHPENPVPAEGYDLGRLLAALPAAVDTALKTAVPDQYTPAKVAAIVADLTARLTAQYGPCTIWPGICTQTGHHDDHINDGIRITSRDGEQLLDVTFTQFSDTEGVSPARISIGSCGSEEYAPEDVRAATARIRRLLDEADALADKVLHTLAGGAR